MRNETAVRSSLRGHRVQDTTSLGEQEPRYSRDSSVFLRWVARIIHPNAPPNCLRPSLPDCLLPKSISLIYIILPLKRTSSPSEEKGGERKKKRKNSGMDSGWEIYLRETSISSFPANFSRAKTGTDKEYRRKQDDIAKTHEPCSHRCKFTSVRIHL